MKLVEFIEGGRAKTVLIAGAIIVGLVVGFFQVETSKKEAYTGVIIKAHKKQKFRSGRRRAFSAVTGNSEANYNYYWDIKTDDGQTLQRKVPIWEWEGSKEGQKVVKEKGTQYPTAIPAPEDIIVVDDEGNEIGTLKEVMDGAKTAMATGNTDQAVAEMQAAAAARRGETGTPPVPPPAPGAPTDAMTVEQKIALMNSNLDAQAAMLQAQSDAKAAPQVANVPPPQAFPSSAIPSAHNYAAQAPPPAPIPEPPPVDPNATPTPAPTPVIYSNVPVSTLWPRYVKAVQLIENNNPQGVTEFERVISSDDIAWLGTNLLLLAELVSPGRRYASAPEAKLVVYKALVRNMPRALDAREPVVKIRGGLAMADVFDKGSAGTVKYSTALVQEGGRWVIAHLFGARDFVWVPQLAFYKQARNMPLGVDEHSYLTKGFAPFQQRVRQVYAMTGYQ